MAIRPAEPLAWEPPSGSRHPYRTAEACPDCGELLLAGPRGTWRACGSCRRAVVPAAVSAPYARSGDSARRHVVSQHERDLEAITLARRKGVMLAQLAQLADDDRLHPESGPVVEWLTGEIRAAATGSRLDQLAALAADPAAGIRRRHWWQNQPAAISADYDDDDDDDQGDDEPAVPAPRLAIAGRSATPAPEQHRMTWRDAVALRGWRLEPGDGCQIRTPDGVCRAGATRYITGGWVCGPHYEQLAVVITGRSA